MDQSDIIGDDSRGPDCAFSFSLRISGDALIPDEITRLMGRSPDLAYVRGGVFHTPRGAPVFGQTGLWLVKGPHKIEGDFDDLVAVFLAGVPASPDVWRKIAENFQIEFFAGVFMGRWNTGFCLSPSVMTLLAERRCEIELDLYGPSDGD